jgi:putative hydrolase of the HAD superfamily
MKRTTPVTCLFVDIGGVLLTNGWDGPARKRTATHFNVDRTEMEHRHHLTFDTYEEGKITLEDYLDRVVFYEKRPFTRAQFRRYMFAQSQPYPEMIALVAQLKRRYGLKIAVVSNEARELNAHRIRTFGLNDVVDAFVSSCFVHIRKPDAEIFSLALDIVQVRPEHVIYIENTPMFVQIAQGLNIRSIPIRITRPHARNWRRSACTSSENDDNQSSCGKARASLDAGQRSETGDGVLRRAT